MAIEHKDAVDPNIHEPKGFAAASNNTIYVKTAPSGVGAWQKLGPDQLNTATVWPAIETALSAGDISPAHTEWVSVVIPDVSTAQTVIVPVPGDCEFLDAYMTLGGAITVANAVVTFEDGSGNSMGTGVTITYSGSAAGTSFSFTPTAYEELTGPTHIHISTDGASNTAAPLYITLRLRVAAT